MAFRNNVSRGENSSFLDDGTAHELRAGALAVDVPDGGLVNYPPAPVPPSVSCGPAGFSIFPYMQILVMSFSARHPVFLGANFAQYTPRLSLARHAPAAAFAAVHQTHARTAPNHHPADRAVRYSSLPSLLCLCLSARVSVLAIGNATPISHLPCPAAFALTDNLACLCGARPSVYPSTQSTLKSQRTRMRRLHGVAAKYHRRARREGGGKRGPERMREVGVHERERGRTRAILARVGSGFATEFGGHRTRNTLAITPLPSLPAYPNPRLNPSLPAPTPPQSSTPTAAPRKMEKEPAEEGWTQDGGHRCLRALLIAHAAWGYIAGQWSGEGALNEWAAGSAARCLPVFLDQAPASGHISGEPRGWHRGREQAEEERGRAGVIYRPPNLAHRPSSPLCASARVSAPAAFHHLRIPIDFQCSLDPILLTVSAFSTCTSSHLFLSSGAFFFRSPAPVPAYLWRASFRPCVTGMGGGFGGGGTSSISLSDVPPPRLRLAVFPPVHHAVSSNAFSLFPRTHSVWNPRARGRDEVILKLWTAVGVKAKKLESER
ncbi:hypothetical protein K438DRAFT_1930923 [Mycena galopus ATCC 62051]|nr:hypothetical protein K438DRAFT_1930923 [Mycena galopus ATCC 62051]